MAARRLPLLRLRGRFGGRVASIAVVQGGLDAAAVMVVLVALGRQGQVVRAWTPPAQEAKNCKFESSTRQVTYESRHAMRRPWWPPLPPASGAVSPPRWWSCAPVLSPEAGPVLAVAVRQLGLAPAGVVPGACRERGMIRPMGRSGGEEGEGGAGQDGDGRGLLGCG